jgi:hypothetical protein
MNCLLAIFVAFITLLTSGGPWGVQVQVHLGLRVAMFLTIQLTKSCSPGRWTGLSFTESPRLSISVASLPRFASYLAVSRRYTLGAVRRIRYRL